jgi:diacylglycerol kinase (ATP)
MEQKNPIHHSFGFALKGIRLVLKERNFKIQLAAALIAIILGIVLHISILEWLAVIFCAALVLCLEMVNTAIEKSIDLVHPEWNEKAGQIKDISAGAVLVVAIASAMIGAIIFVPKILFKCCGGNLIH